MGHLEGDTGGDRMYGIPLEGPLEGTDFWGPPRGTTWRVNTRWTPLWRLPVGTPFLRPSGGDLLDIPPWREPSGIDTPNGPSIWDALEANPCTGPPVWDPQ
jgi:hypothetical protein